LLAKVIGKVHKGELYIDEALREALLTGSDPELAVPHLTSREQMVLELIAQQMTTKDISAKLFISVSRIEACRMDLFLKLGVRNVAGLIRQAIKLGFIQ
jgi:DNA-binding NarL/FixJ family response regulator